MDYDYSLIPPKCSECGAMPINDETPAWMYREYGSCYCKEELVGGSGAIIKDNHGHDECNGECKGSIHVIYNREA